MHLPDSLSDERAHILLPDAAGVICESRHSRYARRFRQYVDISLHYVSRLLPRCYLMLTSFRRFVKEKYGNFTISSVCIKNRNYPLTKWRKCGRITMYIKAHKPLSRRSRVCRCAPESRAMVRARCVCIHEWTCEGKLETGGQGSCSVRSAWLKH